MGVSAIPCTSGQVAMYSTCTICDHGVRADVVRFASRLGWQ